MIMNESQIFLIDLKLEFLTIRTLQLQIKIGLGWIYLFLKIDISQGEL